jgi:hypothetical protein
MAHFAKVQNGLVTQVIVAEPEFFETTTTWVEVTENV